MLLLFGQQGRISELLDSSGGGLRTAHLIDVTDTVDPTAEDELKDGGNIIRELFGRELFNPEYQDRYNRNNGLAVIMLDYLLRELAYHPD